MVVHVNSFFFSCSRLLLDFVSGLGLGRPRLVSLLRFLCSSCLTIPPPPLSPPNFFRPPLSLMTFRVLFPLMVFLQFFHFFFPTSKRRELSCSGPTTAHTVCGPFLPPHAPLRFLVDPSFSGEVIASLDASWHPREPLSFQPLPSSPRVPTLPLFT